jgi:ribosomal protein S18 acetylase RimI-like enzyme
MTPVTFRRARREDLEPIIELLAADPLGKTREVSGAEADPRYVKAFAAIDRDPNQLLAVADDAGGVVGCLQLSFIPGLSRTGMWRGQIESVRIAGSHRGQGLGRQFFEWAIERSRERGCGLLQLTSDKARPDAIRFYESLGFTWSHAGLKLSLGPATPT